MTHGIWTKNVNGKDVVRTAYSPSDAVRFQNDGYRKAQQEVEAAAVQDVAGAGSAEQPAAGQIAVVQPASPDDGTAETAKGKPAQAKAPTTK